MENEPAEQRGSFEIEDGHLLHLNSPLAYRKMKYIMMMTNFLKMLKTVSVLDPHTPTPTVTD